MINENELLQVLNNEEIIKKGMLTKKELDIYTKDLTDKEKKIVKDDVIKLKKDFNITKDTLELISSVKVRTRRLYNTMSDNEYKNFVKNNVYDVRKYSEYDLRMVIQHWILFNVYTKGDKIHLCFDTESCETLESFQATCKIRDKYFKGFDFNAPKDVEVLKAFNEKLDELGHIRHVRVYSWSLGSLGSTKQIHGETLEEFEYILNLIHEELTPAKSKRKNEIVFNTKIVIDVHNLAWDVEFLKYYWHSKMDMKYYYGGTTIDNTRTVHNFMWDGEKIVNDTIEVRKQCLESQPSNSYNIIVGKGQTYQATWQLEDKEITRTVKKVKGQYTWRRTVEFYDMVKRVPMTLANVAEELLIIDKHFQKAEGYDYTKIRIQGEFLSPDEVEYQYNDVFIMVKYLETYVYGRGFEGTTASSVAFNKMLEFKYPDEKSRYRKGFMQHYPTMTHSYEHRIVRKFFRKMYDGGFTSGVKQLEGKLIKDGIIIGIDINSAYPYQMRWGLLPYGEPFYGQGKADIEKLKSKGYDIFFQRVIFDRFKRVGKGITKDGEGYGFIQLNKSKEIDKLSHTSDKFILNGLSYTGRERPCQNFNEDGLILENFECFWDEETLRFMLETHEFQHYHREKVLDKAGNPMSKNCETCFRVYDDLEDGVYYCDYVAFKAEVGYFGEFIDHYIFEKQVGKLLENDGLAYVAKMAMNSCSGKTGSSFTRENVEVIEKPSHLLGYTRPQGGEYEVDKEYYVPYIAFITSYTRLRLMKIIYALETAHGFNSYSFQGCDTDSLYIKLPYNSNCNTLNKMLQYIQELGIELDAIKLGAWDIEKVIFKYKNLGSKKMMMDFTKISKLDKDKDVLELMKEYKEDKIKTSKKVTCAGLPDDTREVIAKKGFDYFDKNIDYIKKIREKAIGGYMLNYGTHRIQDSLFN